MIQEHLKGFQVKPDYIDNDYLNIIFEYMMNYSIDSVRQGYHKALKDKENAVDVETLRKLGYSEEDIKNFNKTKN